MAKGANPKANDSRALLYAAQNSHLEVVRLLLPVSDPKAGGSLALQYAAESGHLEIVKLLLPFSSCAHMLKDPDFIQSPGCDLLLSCLPPARARKFMAAHPKVSLPRSRAMLAADSLQQRPATSHKAATQRWRA